MGSQPRLPALVPSERGVSSVGLGDPRTGTHTDLRPKQSRRLSKAPGLLYRPRMRLELSQLNERTQVELPDGELRLGGGEEDAIRIEGLAPGLLALVVEGDRLTVTSAETLSIDEVFFPARVARLLLPGETVSLGCNVRVRVLAAPAPPAGTAALLRHLLGQVTDPPRTRAATLTCLTGLDSGRAFPLGEAAAEIGRGMVQIRIRDRAVSRRHAAISRTDGQFFLQDLGGPNGVYVNGKRLTRATALHDGDIVELGHSVLRFDAPAEEPGLEIGLEKDPMAPDVESGPGGASARQRGEMEWALLGLGAALAVAGVLVTWGLAW